MEARTPKIVTVATIEGPDFYCGAIFMFNPRICVECAPKLENLFLHRGLEKCERIAKQRGWRFAHYEVTDSGKPLPENFTG